jgi:hypothetical protein
MEMRAKNEAVERERRQRKVDVAGRRLVEVRAEERDGF